MHEEAGSQEIPLQGASALVLPAGQRRIVWGLLGGLTLLSTALLWPAYQPNPAGFDDLLRLCIWNVLWAGGVLALATGGLVWAVLADRPLTVRGPRAAGFLLLQAWCLTWGLRHSAADNTFSTYFAGLALVLFVLQGVLLLPLRWPLRWRLQLADQAANPARSQFTVRQALLWTAGAAALLALGKSVPPDCDTLDIGYLLVLPVVALILIAIIFPTAVASLGMILGRSRRLVWALVSGFLVLATAAILTAMVFRMVSPGLASLPPTQQALVFALPLFFQGGFVLIFWGTLTVLRLCGYRLVRRPKGQAAVPKHREAEETPLEMAGPHGQDARGTSDEPEGGCPFAITGPHSCRRSPFSYLVAGLVLLGLGVALVAVWQEGPRREARAQLALIQPWRTLGVDVSMYEGRISNLTFLSLATGQAISEEALRKLAELEQLYGPSATPQNLPGEPTQPFPAVFFSGSAVTDAQLRYLHEVPSLLHLGLDGTKISDAGLVHLEGLKHLQTLNLSGTAISDAGLASLKPLPALSTLDLSGTKISDAGVRQLCELPALSQVNLQGTQITPAGLALLQAMPHLDGLQMPGTITDADLAQLRSLLERLDSLDLSGTSVTDAGLASLAGMKHLSYLVLTGTGVTDASLEHVKDLPQLRQLLLDGTRVTDAGLARLESCPQLNHLQLGPRVSRAAALRWKQARPDRMVFYQQTPGGGTEMLP